MPTVTIYGLRDPRTGDLRYVGSTNNLRSRLYSHKRTAAKGSEPNPKTAWLSDLYTFGLEPCVVVLDECEAKNRNKTERRWILALKKDGVPLLNVTGSDHNSLMAHVFLDSLEPDETFNARAQRLYEHGHSMCACGHQMCFHDSEGRCIQCDCTAEGWETE